jgi:hypothetical protein
MLLLLCAAALAATPDDATFRPLNAPTARSSSFLKSNWNKFTENYHPAYLLDGDPKTAWVEGVQGTGAGQWVEWDVSPVTDVHRVQIRLRNGYQKSDALLTANAAPKTLRIALLQQDRVVHSETWTVERAMGWQERILDPASDIAFDRVRLTVEDVVEGRTYADLCISDVEVRVDSDARYNAPIENAKQQALMRWIAERRNAAAFFAKQPKTWPFVATRFTDEPQPFTEDDKTTRIATWDAEQARHDALMQASHRVRAVFTDTTPLPDGVYLDDELARWLTSEVTLFEAQGDTRPVRPSDEPWRKELQRSTIHVTADTPAEGHTSLAWTTKSEIAERSTIQRSADWMLVREGERPVAATKLVLDEGESEGCKTSAHLWSWSFEWTDGETPQVRAIHSQLVGWCMEAVPGAEEMGGYRWGHRTAMTPNE